MRALKPFDKRSVHMSTRTSRRLDFLFTQHDRAKDGAPLHGTTVQRSKLVQSHRGVDGRRGRDGGRSTHGSALWDVRYRRGYIQDSSRSPASIEKLPIIVDILPGLEPRPRVQYVTSVDLN